MRPWVTMGVSPRQFAAFLLMCAVVGGAAGLVTSAITLSALGPSDHARDPVACARFAAVRDDPESALSRTRADELELEAAWVQAGCEEGR